ncbi:cadherin-related family member 5-like isoform X17 [Petromyzon marinus]|uniref:cadherin-related family member 5-like isoform X17 n=1 Tax=Petromyzon marinus TaxID=7757 RepID=UPI003F6F23E8
MALRPWALCLLFSLMLWAENTDAVPCNFNFQPNSSIFNAEVTENSENNYAFFNIPVEGNITEIVLAIIPNNIFTLRDKQLQVANKTALDRETLGETVILALTCKFNDVENRATIAVNILDVNEFDPEFQGTPYKWNISEFSSVSTTFPVPATDKDRGQITYTLDESVPGVEYFEVPLLFKGEISLNKTLKYEDLYARNLTTIALIVKATDSNPSRNATGYTNRTSTATVTVSVIDQDDQPPIFQPKVCSTVADKQLCVNAKYSATVRENVMEESIVFAPAQIRAEDGDKGINAIIKYALLSENDFFEIDASNGQIRMKEVVPSKTQTPEINLQIVAYQDDFQKFTTTTATIKVVTKNESHPAFPEVEYCGHVPNNADVVFATMCNSPNTLQLQVNDADYATGHPIVEYTIVGAGMEHIEINPTGYVLVRSSNLDAGQQYMFDIEAKDIENGDISTTRLTINVQAGSDGSTVTGPQITAGGSDRPTVTGPQPTAGGSDRPTVTGPHPTVGGSDRPTAPVPQPTAGGSDRPTVTGPHPTDGGSNRPTAPDPRPTAGGSDSPTLPDPRPTAGGPEKIYTAQDMAIVGGVLGALLAVALGVIGFLLFKVLSKQKKAVKIEDDAKYGGGGGDDDGGYANSRNGSGQQDDISIADMGRDDDPNMVNYYIHLPKDHMQDTDVDRSSGYNSVSGRPTTPLRDAEEDPAPQPQPRDNPAFAEDAAAVAAAAAAADDEQAIHTKSILVTVNSNEKAANDKAGYKAVWFKDEVIPDGGEAADEADGRAGGVRFDGEPADDAEGKESSGAAAPGSGGPHGLDSSAMHTGGAVAEEDEFAFL